MSDAIDIIGGYDSLDDILSGTASALAAVAGHLDVLRAATYPLAKEMLHRVEVHMQGILAATLHLIQSPGDAQARAAHKQHGIALHRYGAEASELLARLQR